MKVQFGYFLLTLALILTAIGPAAVQAQESDSFVAKVDVSDDAVTFHPEGRYVGFVLQVAGPQDFYLEQPFTGDETPSLRLKTERGKLIDGSYTIQVTAQPEISKKAHAAMIKARDEGDREAMYKLRAEAGLNERAMVYSMSVGVAEGKFLSPTEEEPKGDVKQMKPDEEASDGLGVLTPVLLTPAAPDFAETSRGPATTSSVAAPDVTRAALNEAIQPVDDEDTLPEFIARLSGPDAHWFQAHFQNVMPDGSNGLFEGWLHAVESNGSDQVFHAFFRRAAQDGSGYGNWIQGYFKGTEGNYTLLAPDEVTRADADEPAQAQLFDYLAEEPGAAPAAAPRRDHVINDDCIILGSMCVGLDCVNGMNFGFDTLVLQENNLRMFFNDTSNSASFPTNNWRLIANDSSNGGNSYFAIEDSDGGRRVFEVRAGAAANSLFVSSSSRIGLKTNTPSVEVHVADGDTPTVRLEQNGTSGFTPHTWDVAGNETNFFIRDVTSGSRLPFRIRPGAGTSSIDINDGLVEMNGDAANIDFVVRGDAASSTTLFVDADAQGGEGGVGIGTDTPGIDLNITNDNPQMRWTTGNVRLFAAIALAGATEGHFELRDVSAGNLARIRLRAATSATNPGDVEIPTGDLIVSGNITKGGGGFKIDHPLNPENQFLYHSFVESPERMNVYNGNIVLDGNGAAVVELPEYFQALNQDFRYQLTAIGAPGPNLYVAREIDGNRFQIAGGTAGMKVSWQVTGVRQDPWAIDNPMPAVQDKPAAMQGFFLHPQALKQPLARGIEYQQGEQAREDLRKLEEMQVQQDRQ